MPLNVRPTFFPTPLHFRRWLEKYHNNKNELWVGFYKKHTGRPSLTWPESVDQVLCFGWIDGIRKSIDEEAYMIRFTPRRPTSIWSSVNIRRFGELKALGLITSAGQAAFDAKKAQNTRRYSFEQGTLQLPPAFEKKIKSNKSAWRFFESLPPSVKKPSIWYVMSAKQKTTQLRRLEILIRCSEAGQRIPPLRTARKQ